MLNHEETCFNPKLIDFHDFWMMTRMQAMVGFFNVMECSMKKSLSLMRCVLSWVEKWWSEMKSEVLETRDMFPLEMFWFEKQFFPQNWVRSSFVEKNLFVLSHQSSSLTLQRKMTKMRLKGSKYGVYILAWMQRVGQNSLKYWLETL